jgi:hypothetical protein
VLQTRRIEWQDEVIRAERDALGADEVKAIIVRIGAHADAAQAASCRGGDGLHDAEAAARSVLDRLADQQVTPDRGRMLALEPTELAHVATTVGPTPSTACQRSVAARLGR